MAFVVQDAEKISFRQDCIRFGLPMNYIWYSFPGAVNSTLCALLKLNVCSKRFFSVKAPVLSIIKALSIRKRYNQYPLAFAVII
jgi:hypothetical protein